MSQRLALRRLLRFVVPCALLTGGVAVWAACSSDSPAVDTGAGSDAGSEPTDTGTGVFVPSDTGPPVVPDAGPDGAYVLPPFDAGPLVFIDAGPDVDGGLECYVGGEPEVEPNDDVGTANVLRPIRCGVISVPPSGGPDGGESDWLTFEVADASTGFELYYHGQVHVLVQTGDSGVTDITVPGQRLPFVKGQPYYIEVRSEDGGTQAWQVVLHEDLPDGG